jgi:hypothetical protein
MDSCQFLSYIIIALIVALVIHLVSKVLKPQLEGMASIGSCSSGKVWGPSEKKTNVISLIEDVEDKITRPEPVIEGMSADVIRGEVGNINNSGCTICKTSDTVDDYIRESLLHNANVCKEDKVLKPEEINKHRDEYLAFRNGVWQPSSTEDAVDRINDLYLSGSNDISRNHKDVKIKDLYDQLTKAPSVYTENCVKMPNVDDATRNGDYIVAGSRGNFHPRDNWVYGEEKVMNGGEFMTGVFPSDEKCQHNMAL